MSSRVPEASDEDSPVGAQRGVIAAFSGGVTHPRRERSIGAILLDVGRLTLEGTERILQLQAEKGLPFGEAGKELGLLTHADIEFALLRQFDYPHLVPGESEVSESVVAAYDPFKPEVEALRALRSQLMLRWFDNDPRRKALAIISSARQEGRSLIAANLAVVFSQLGARTVLVDADLRHPKQHELFGVSNRLGLSAALSGRAGPEAAQPIPSLQNLCVLPSGALPPNPQELLARPFFQDFLEALGRLFDVVLLDSPPAGQTADAQIIAVRAGAALVVTRKNASRAWRVQGVSDRLLEAKATIVGSVLNDF